MMLDLSIVMGEASMTGLDPTGGGGGAICAGALGFQALTVLCWPGNSSEIKSGQKVMLDLDNRYLRQDVSHLLPYPFVPVVLASLPSPRLGVEVLVFSDNDCTQRH